MVDIFLKGGPVMYPLLLCSILSLTVIIERTFFWIREDVRRNQPLVDGVLELCRRGDWDGVRERVAGSSTGNFPWAGPWRRPPPMRS